MFIIAPVPCSLQLASLPRPSTFIFIAPLHCHSRPHRPRPRARPHSHSRSTSPRSRTWHTRLCARHRIAHTHIASRARGTTAHAHGLTLHSHTSLHYTISTLSSSQSHPHASINNLNNQLIISHVASPHRLLHSYAHRRTFQLSWTLLLLGLFIIPGGVQS